MHDLMSNMAIMRPGRLDGRLAKARLERIDGPTNLNGEPTYKLKLTSTDGYMLIESTVSDTETTLQLEDLTEPLYMPLAMIRAAKTIMGRRSRKGWRVKQPSVTLSATEDATTIAIEGRSVTYPNAPDGTDWPNTAKLWPDPNHYVIESVPVSPQLLARLADVRPLGGRLTLEHQRQTDPLVMTIRKLELPRWFTTRVLLMPMSDGR